jgi:hypothetical protein
MSIQNTTRNIDSTDRIAALTASRPSNPVLSSKTAVGRFSHTANRILNALMRTLATPHI